MRKLVRSYYVYILFLFVIISFFSKINIAKGLDKSVEFLNFVQGNPGFPSDGIFTTGDSNSGFDLVEPFSLAGITDGITVSVFPRDTVNFNNIQIDVDAGIGAPCIGATTEFFLSTPIVFNGATGFAGNFPQEHLQSLVDIINQNPECNLILSDLKIVKLHVFTLSGNRDLDAAAISMGQNKNPSNDFITSFDKLSLVFVPFIPSTQMQSLDILDGLIGIANKFNNFPTEKKIQIIEKVLLDMIKIYGCISVGSCAPNLPPPNPFTCTPPCQVAVTIEQFEMASSPSTLYQLFNFDLFVQIENPEDFPVGTRFVTDIPFLGIGPSFSIIEFKNIINTPEEITLQLSVEGITLTNPEAPRIISDVPTLSVGGMILLVFALGVIGFFGFKKYYPSKS